MDNIVKILFSVAGAEAVTGSLDKIKSGSASLGGELLKLGGVAFSLQKAMSGVANSLEFGRQLEITSMRTGQAVKDVVILGAAFKKVGMDADDVGKLVNKLQKALSGVNEMGESTAGVLRQLGLSQSELKDSTAIEQVQLLARGFQRIEDPARRAAIAMSLFGREGGQMIGLLSNPAILDGAVAGASRIGQRMQDNSAAFKEALDGIEKIKSRMKELWVVATVQLLPAINMVASATKTMNLGPLGAGVGSGVGLAVAGGIAAGLAARLNTMLMEWATNPGTSAAGTRFASNFALPLTSRLSSFFSTALPTIIITAIGAALIKGIEQALLDKQTELDAIRARLSNEGSAVTKDLAHATSEEDWERRKKIHEEELKRDEKKLDGLRKLKKEVEDYNAELAETAKKDGTAEAWASYSLSAKKMTDAQLAELDALEKKVAAVKRDLAAAPRPEMLKANREREGNFEFEGAGKNLKELLEKQRDAEIAVADRRQQLSMLEADLTKLEAKRTTADTGLSKEDREAKSAIINTEILKTKQKIEEVNKSLKADEEFLSDTQLEAQFITAKAAGRAQDAQALAEQIARTRMLKELRDHELQSDPKALAALEAKIQAMREAFNLEQRSLQFTREVDSMRDEIAKKQLAEQDIINDFSKTEDEKWPLKKKNLEEQLALQTALVKKLTEERDLALKSGDQPHADQLTGQINTGTNDGIGTQGRLGQLGPNPQSFASNWRRVLADLRQQWTITGRTVADTFGTAINSAMQGTKSALTGLLDGTQDWGDFLGNIGQTLRTSVASAVSDLFVKWIAGRAAAAMASIGWSTKEGAADAAAKAPGAVLTSISSFGTAAIVGVAAIVAAMAAFGGFKRGGHTGAGGNDDVRGVVHANEWVAPAWMTTHPTFAPVIGALEHARSGSPGYAMGGFASGDDIFTPPSVRLSNSASIAAAQSAARTGSPGVASSGGALSRSRAPSGDVNMAFFNTQQEAEEWLKSTKGRRVMVDFMRQQKFAVG